MSSTRTSVAWTYAGQLIGFVAAFGGSVVVARLLSPAEMGVFAIAAALIGIIGVLTSFDIGSYVVREKELSPERFDTAFTVNALLALSLAAVIFAASFAAELLLGDARAGDVLRLLALVPAVGPFSFRPAAMLQRDMRFRALSLIKLAGVVGGAGVTVSAALAGFGYMSPAYGALAGALLMSLGHIVAAPRHFSLRCSFACWAEVTRFGLAMASITGLASLVSRLCELMLGRFLGVTALGLYSRASTVSGMVLDNAYLAASRVLFSRLAADQREHGSLAETYLRGQQLLLAVVWPLLGGLAVLAGPVVQILYGDRWLPAAAPLSLLLLALIPATAVGLSWELFVLRREVGRQTRLEAVRAAVALAFFAVGLRFGLVGAAVARAAEALVGFAIYFPHVVRLAGTGREALLRLYRRSGALTLAACLPALALMGTTGWSAHQSPLHLAAAVGAGGLLWLGTLAGLRHPLLDEIRSVARRLAPRRAAPAFALPRGDGAA